MAEKTGARNTGTGRRSRKLEALEISLLCHQIALVLKSGIHPIEGIPMIAEEIGNPQLKAALTQTAEAVVQGTPLHVAFSQVELFPDYLVAMTRLGEASGMLEHVMETLSAYYEKEDKMARQIRSAIAYPALLAILMLGVMVLLVARILPMFSRILSSLGSELPPATRLLLGVGDFLGQWGLWALVLVALLLGALFAWIRSSRGHMAWDRFKLRLPILGKVLLKMAAARFSEGLSVVLGSGMELSEGLDQVSGLPGNLQVRHLLKEVAGMVQNGQELGTALSKVALFPPLFTRMIQIGQRTGELDRMMEKISSVYEGEVDQSIKQMTNAIEPLLVILLSVVVGVILLAVMLPLIHIMGSIG